MYGAFGGATKAEFKTNRKIRHFNVADYVILQSTMSGYVSNRNRKEGSPFAQIFNKTMDNYAPKEELTSIVQRIKNACSNPTNEKFSAQQPQLNDTLRTFFLFYTSRYNN